MRSPSRHGSVVCLFECHHDDHLGEQTLLTSLQILVAVVVVVVGVVVVGVVIVTFHWLLFPCAPYSIMGQAPVSITQTV